MPDTILNREWDIVHVFADNDSAESAGEANIFACKRADILAYDKTLNGKRVVLVLSGALSAIRAHRVVALGGLLRERGATMSYVLIPEASYDEATEARGRQVDLVFSCPWALAARARTEQAAAALAEVSDKKIAALQQIEDAVWMALLARDGEIEVQFAHQALLPGKPGRKVLTDRVASARAAAEDATVRGAQEGGDEPDLESIDSTFPFLTWRGRMCKMIISKQGERFAIPFTNFTAKISRSMIVEDGTGANRRGEYEVTVQVGNHYLPRQRVQHEEYEACDWLTTKFPNGAFLASRDGVRRDFATALRYLSEPIPSETRYERTGWAAIDGKLCYLHSGGAIGTTRNVKSAFEASSRLSMYNLPPSVDPKQEYTAVLDLLKVREKGVTAVGVGAAFLAPLARLLGAKFYVWLYGKTGAGKTLFLALVQSFFGAEFGPQTLPASFEGTHLAIKKTLSKVHDALVGTDNYLSSLGNDTLLTRLLHSLGDGSERSRVKTDGTDLQGNSDISHSLMFATGEQAPPADEGALGRGVIVHVPACSLTQEHDHVAFLERRTDLNRAMTDFVTWLQPRVNDEAWLHEQLTWVADTAAKIKATKVDDAHARAARNLSFVLLGVHLMLERATAVGATTHEDVTRIMAEASEALGIARAAQASLAEDSGHPTRFLQLLSTAINRGDTCIVPVGTPRSEAIRRHACGWYDDTYIYLKPDWAFSAAQRIEPSWRPGPKKGLWLALAQEGLADRGSRTARDVAESGSITELVHLWRTKVDLWCVEDDLAGTTPGYTDE